MKRIEKDQHNEYDYTYQLYIHVVIDTSTTHCSNKNVILRAGVNNWNKLVNDIAALGSGR